MPEVPANAWPMGCTSTETANRADLKVRAYWIEEDTYELGHIQGSVAPAQGRSEDPVGQADGQRPGSDRRPEREAHRQDPGTLRLRERQGGTGIPELQGCV